MSIPASFIPRSINGIKRLAKSLKSELACPHHEALDLAAQRAGFQNFIHALRTVEAPVESPRHPVTIGVPWSSIDDRGRRRTTIESFTMYFPKPLDEIVRARDLSKTRGLRGFARASADALEWIGGTYRTDDVARAEVCACFRTLQFMDRTGLRPSNAFQKAAPRGGRSSDRSLDLPRRDHTSLWTDPATGEFVYLDEPYELDAAELERRDAWAASRHWTIAAPRWAGTYAPDLGSRPYLVCDARSTILPRIVEAVDRIGHDVPRASNWEGVSNPMW